MWTRAHRTIVCGPPGKQDGIAAYYCTVGVARRALTVLHSANSGKCSSQEAVATTRKGVSPSKATLPSTEANVARAPDATLPRKGQTWQQKVARNGCHVAPVGGVVKDGRAGAASDTRRT